MRCAVLNDAIFLYQVFNMTQASATHPILDKPAFSRIPQKFQPEFVVDSFDELSEMEIRSQKGASCRPLTHIASSHVATIFCNHLAKLLQKIVAS